MKTLVAIICILGLLLSILVVPYDLSKDGVLHEGKTAYVLIKGSKTYGFIGIYNYGAFKAYALLSQNLWDYIDWGRLKFHFLIFGMPMLWINNRDE